MRIYNLYHFSFYFPLLVYIIQFEEVLNQPNPSTDLQKLVDPRLGENYPMDSVCEVKKMIFLVDTILWDHVSLMVVVLPLTFQIAQLAKACTLHNHVLRPSMRSVVVALTTLISGTGDRYVSSSDKLQDLVNIMSRR